MKKRKHEIEIDLFDLIHKLQNGKWIIFFTTIFVVLLTYFFFINRDIPKINAEIKLNHISILEESNYKIYNSYVKSLKAQSMGKNNIIIKDYKEFSLLNENSNNVNTNFLNISPVQVPDSVVNDLLISNVDKKFLYDLFVSQLQENLYLLKSMQNTNFDKDYLPILSTLKIEKRKKMVFLSFQINPDKKEKFTELVFLIENFINQEVQEKLSVMFDNYIEFINEIRKIQIEDLEFKYSIANEKQRDDIKTAINFVEQDRYVQRLKKIYSDSPLSNKKKFHAARLSVSKISSDESKQNLLRFMTLASVLGLLLGIFISLIINVKTRRY